MPQPCRTCRHPRVAEINTALVRGAAAQAIAADYRLGARGVQRHREAHIPKVLHQAQDAVEIAEGDRLLAELRELHETTRGIIRDALRVVTSDFDGRPLRPNNDDRTVALKAIEVGRRNIELLLRVFGELEERAEARRAAHG